MLIPLKPFLEEHKIKLNSVLHIGAHWAEEDDHYLECGIKKRIYVEPCKDAFNKLQEKFKDNQDVKLFNCACADYSGVSEMFTENNNQGQSNSLLKPHLHTIQHSEIKFNTKELVEVRRLDDLQFDRNNCELLMMDTQGAELLVLKGGTETLKHVKVVYTEVNKDYMYEGCALINELDDFMAQYGLIRTQTLFAGNFSWGDAIFIHKSLL